jgi:hypothetical protein
VWRGSTTRICCRLFKGSRQTTNLPCVFYLSWIFVMPFVNRMFSMGWTFYSRQTTFPTTNSLFPLVPIHKSKTRKTIKFYLNSSCENSYKINENWQSSIVCMVAAKLHMRWVLICIKYVVSMLQKCTHVLLFVLWDTRRRRCNNQASPQGQRSASA